MGGPRPRKSWRAGAGSTSPAPPGGKLTSKPDSAAQKEPSPNPRKRRGERRKPPQGRKNDEQGTRRLSAGMRE